MTNQEKLDFKEKYKNNPVAFVEDFYPDIKLHAYQKAMLNAMYNNGWKPVSYYSGRINQKMWIENFKLEYMIAMEMNFEVWRLDGIDVYERGVLVRTIKHN